MPASPSGQSHRRWARTVESSEFFMAEEQLRRGFYGLAAGALVLLAALTFSLWRLQAAALAPPVVVGIAHGLVFTGKVAGLSSVRDDDFDLQLADTVEVLFGRTEKGLPPALRDFAAPEVIASVNAGYGEAAAKYPAGYAQTLALIETKVIERRTGFRRVRYRGVLASRSLAAAQVSAIYLECTFVIGAPTPRNTSGWHLLRVTAIGADDYYASERAAAARARVQAPAPLPP